MGDRTLLEKALLALTGILTSSRDDVEKAIKGENDSFDPPLKELARRLGLVSKAELDEVIARLERLEAIAEEKKAPKRRGRRKRRTARETPPAKESTVKETSSETDRAFEEKKDISSAVSYNTTSEPADAAKAEGSDQKPVKRLEAELVPVESENKTEEIVD